MFSTEHTQSLSDFRQKATETLDRLNRTGEAEIITVNGEARAVLLSPAAYHALARELEISRDVAAINKAMTQFEQGKGIPIEQAHQQLRVELMAMKVAQGAENVKSRPVEIVPAVLDDIRKQMRDIAQDSIDNALAWEDRVMTVLAGLADFHGHALDTDAGDRLGYPVRRLVFERTYLIHYHVDEAAGIVRVVQFRHGARLPLAEER